MTNTSTVEPATDTGAAVADDELLTIAEVAEKLRLKPWAVSKLVQSGALPSVYISHKARRVKPGDLRAYIDALPSVRPATGVDGKNRP